MHGALLAIALPEWDPVTEKYVRKVLIWPLCGDQCAVHCGSVPVIAQLCRCCGEGLGRTDFLWRQQQCFTAATGFFCHHRITERGLPSCGCGFVSTMFCCHNALLPQWFVATMVCCHRDLLSP